MPLPWPITRPLEIDPNDAANLNHLAWLRPLVPARISATATLPSATPCKLASRRSTALPGYLDTLAAAFAEAGRFEDAVRWQEKAVALVESDHKADYESRLVLYQAGQPYREAEEPVEPPNPTSQPTSGESGT